MFNSSNKMFLYSLDIHTTYSSIKLSYYYLEPYIVEKQVRLMLYCFKLPPMLCRLYLVFHVVKLTLVPNNLILGICSSSSLNLIIIDREEKWRYKKVLKSC